jgi:signal transduction histidine kinase
MLSRGRYVYAFAFILCLHQHQAIAGPLSEFIRLDSIAQFEGDERMSVSEIYNSRQYADELNEVINLGLGDKHHYLKFYVFNESRESAILYISNATIDDVVLYQATNEIAPIAHHVTSEKYYENILPSNGIAMDLQLTPGRGSWYMLELKSNKQLVTTLSVGTRFGVLKKSSGEDYLMFFYFGIIAVLFAYNLFLFMSTGEQEYLNYSGYIISIGLTQFVIFGYGHRFIWPQNTWLRLNSIQIMGGISGYTTIQFARQFLRTNKLMPKLDKVLLFYTGSAVFAVLLAIAGFQTLSYNVINFNAASSLLLLVAAVIAARSGLRSAKFFLIAWSIFILCVTIYAMKDFGVLPYHFWTNYALPVGSAIEGILLSFALADRINLLKKDKAEADQLRIQSMESQTELLEERVHARTIELEVAKNEIQAQLDHLRLTQKQLVDAEKMAGLGQMTAGIAHELNNPINFVHSNVEPLRRDVQDLLDIAKLLQAIPMGERTPMLQEIYKKLDEADIALLDKEIPLLLKGIEEGSNRTAEIVKGLRIFARADRETLIRANINDCISSTIIVMNNAIHGVAIIEKSLDASMPPMECFPGKLNQVFANLIGNAVQAFQGSDLPVNKRLIKVASSHTDSDIQIMITDNGCGIKPEKIAKIFDPFFTTKGVGEGTGLGLSIAKGIIEEHRGEIKVISTVGEGTTFIITLPR